MSGYLFENAHYLALSPAGLPELRRGTIAVEKDRIVAIQEEPLNGTDFESFERIDTSRKVIAPGLINAHTHSVLMVLRGTVEDIEGNLVYQYMVPASYLLEPAERAAIAEFACLEAIRCGTTTMVDPLRHVADYAQAMADSGMRLYLCESAADAVTTKVSREGYVFDRDWGTTFLDRTHALIEKFHGAEDGRVQAMIAAHAPDNCSPWMLAELRKLAAAHNLRRTVHLSQIISEVKQVEALHGMTSTEYLRENDWLGSDLLAVHWTFCTESDVEILAAHDVHFIHSPASMSAKGPHKLPIKAILESGINIALATDNMTTDMFQSMKMALVIHRGAYGRSVMPGPGNVFNYATVNAAKALDRPDLGHISVGAKADLALYDMSTPVLVPRISLVSNIVHYGHPGIVTDTMVDGRFLMRDGQVLSMDERAVVDKAQSVTDAMWSRFRERERDVEMPHADRV
ncbi:amidohydrolase family protein [Hwanghaeella sp.]|uniref:amidohydrolase family protein n=1 Tax=Hwanghaeella sp. TaxID=2605943 RepID=UPI003CCBDA86